MQLSRAVLALALLTTIYIGALFVLDAHNKTFDRVGQLVELLPIVAAISLASFSLRYARWRWLLRQRGYAFSGLHGFLGYIAGFAFTASPGKIGELVRIRYFTKMGVPAELVVACFVFERLVDLVTLLLIATLLASAVPGFAVAVVFVALVFVAVLFLGKAGRFWVGGAKLLRLARLGVAAPGLVVLRQGIVDARVFVNFHESSLALVVGLAAWVLQACGFAFLIRSLQIDIAIAPALAIQPLATLLGAASLLPGGIGTTEAAIVVLLAQFGVSLELGALAAIGTRLGTLWFATLIGIAAMLASEYVMHAKEPDDAPSSVPL